MIFLAYFDAAECLSMHARLKSSYNPIEKLFLYQTLPGFPQADKKICNCALV